MLPCKNILDITKIRLLEDSTFDSNRLADLLYFNFTHDEQRNRIFIISCTYPLPIYTP